ncbi:flippase [Fibrella aquatilis]|uniref:Flippase n=1 Tax=Fibrella aquatilis TaxID=2817059 RepID=A0A939JXE5_9BACT|nr:flippase [Fibrella aquatilis]MBO0930954.1 flippase [Fibrella aquatilis]
MNILQKLSSSQIRLSLRNAGWMFFDKIFRMATSLLVGIWLARYLGPEQFGILNYAILFPTIFLSIAGFGLNNILMIEYTAAAGDLLKQRKLVSGGVYIKFTIGCLTYLMSFLANYILNYSNDVLFVIINITGSVLIFQSSEAIDTYFQARSRAKLSVIVKSLALFTTSIFRIYAIINKLDIIYFVMINFIELLISYILTLIVVRTALEANIFDIIKEIDLRIIKKLSSQSWPIMLSEFFVFIYMKIDQFMIKSLSTDHEIGYYTAALRLSEVWYFIAIAITASFYPNIAKYYDSDRKNFLALYQKLINILSFISIIISIFISMFSSSLVYFIFGEQYTGVAPILSVHIWSGVFVFTGVGISNLMVIENLQKFILVKTIIGAFVNVLLNIWLIPRFGALGASVATLIAYSLSAYFLNFFYTKAKFIFAMQTQSFTNFLTLKSFRG